MKPISVKTRDRILACVDNGMSDRKVATIIGESRSSVRNVRKNIVLMRWLQGLVANLSFPRKPRGS